MGTRNLFYRNVRAGELFDLFLVSAVSSLLLLRYFLYLTNYPQVGGSGLHIAHMLYGGLFMLAALTIRWSFLGWQAARLSALLGGIGFGVFIDEIGKFLTRDNDYFYRPAIGIIYALFIVLYLTFNFLSRKQRLTSREYQLNAMNQLEEAIVHDMDPAEKRRAQQLLSLADGRSEVTRQLQKLLNSVDLIPQNQPDLPSRILTRLDMQYKRLWARRTTDTLVKTFFIVEVAIFVLAIGAGSYANINDIFQLRHGVITYGAGLVIGQFAASIIAAGYAIYGAVQLRNSRRSGFEYFRRATLVNLYLTEFFVFSRIQFAALPGFIFNVGVLLLVTYSLHQEQRLHSGN